MNTNVIPMFAYNDQQLRGVKIDGEPWFIAMDALRCLGFDTRQGKLGGVTKRLTALDADEKRTIRRGEDTFRPLFAATPASAMTLVSRPGLFKLIQRSNKPEAKAFDRWVRHEVLPQIMDNGGYMARDADVQAVVDAAPDNKARTDLDLMKTVMSAMQAMQERIGELESEAEVAAPKVAFVDQYVSAKGALSLDTAARTLGLGSGIELCALLRENDVLFYRKQGKVNVNMARKSHLDAGRFHQLLVVRNMSTFFGHSGGIAIQTMVTSVGMAWLSDQLPRFIGKRAEREARDATNAARRDAIAAALKSAAN